MQENKVEREYVIRDQQQKIRAHYKVNISNEIEIICKKNFEQLFYEQTKNFIDLFMLLDSKQICGLLGEIQINLVGINDYDNLSTETKRKCFVQLQRCYDGILTNMTNIIYQLLFALRTMQDNILDQPFLSKMIYGLFELQTIIDDKRNNLIPTQKEVIHFLVKELIDLYNSRLDRAIQQCCINSSFWTKCSIFSNLINQGYSLLDASYQLFVISDNQENYKNYLIANKIHIDYKTCQVELKENKNETSSSKLQNEQFVSTIY